MQSSSVDTDIENRLTDKGGEREREQHGGTNACKQPANGNPVLILSCMTQGTQTGALSYPREVGMGRRWEGDS